MQTVRWLLVGIVIAVGFVGGYFQLQIFANSKPEKVGSVWLGGWVFHPEYLEKEGQIYRKRVIACWAVVLLLILVMKIFQTQ